MKNLAPYSAGYSDIDVSIVDYDKNIARHAWNCYRMTWRELQDVEYDVNDKRVREAIHNIIAFKALPMPREQALMTFRIENASRVCLAQITRQRKAAFNVESQMPQPVGHNVIIPLNIWQNENLRKEAIELCEASQNFYNKLVDMGIPYQDARYMLIHGQTTSFVYVVDINTFCGSFAMRCENNLSDEINLVYRLCLHRMLEQLEKDYECGDIDELTYLFYKDILAGCDCQGAKQKKGMNTDKVFGNSFMRFNDANEEVTAATVNCTCDFKKSAWYAELMRMYDNEEFELLFPGEKEMIERWKAGIFNET